MSYSQKTIDALWQKLKPIYSRDASLYRLDDADNILYKPSYGKRTRMGWEIDHIKPISKGGKNETSNLRCLHWLANRQKGVDRLKNK